MSGFREVGKGRAYTFQDLGNLCFGLDLVIGGFWRKRRGIGILGVGMEEVLCLFKIR